MGLIVSENPGRKKYQGIFLQIIKQEILRPPAMHSLFLTEGMNRFPSIRGRNFSGQEKRNTAARKQEGKMWAEKQIQKKA